MDWKLKHTQMLKILEERAESKDYQQKALSMVRCQTKETPLEIIRQMHNHREVGLQGQK